MVVLGLWIGEKSCAHDAHHHRSRRRTHHSLGLQPWSRGLLMKFAGEVLSIFLTCGYYDKVFLVFQILEYKYAVW